MANGEAGFGLNNPGDGSLGLGQSIASAPVAPSAVNNLSAPVPASGGDDPFISQDMRDILAAGLLAFGANDAQAGINAVTSAKNRRAQQAQLKRQNMVQSMKIGADLATSAASLPKEQRPAFIKATTGTLTEGGDEAAAKIFSSLANRPDHIVAIGGLEETDIGKQLIQQDPSGRALADFATSPQGETVLNQITDQQITPGAFQKLQGITGSLDSLARKGHIDKTLLERVQKDGKISIPEMQQLAESMPEGHPLKLGPAEISAATAERNLDTLRSVGISLAEDFEPEEQTLQAQDNIVDKDGNFVGVGIFDPKEGFKVQTESGIRPLKGGERTVKTAGGLEDTGLTKKTTSELQNTLISSTSASDRIGSTIASFDKEFLTITGKAKFKALALADQAGIPLSDELKGELTKFAEFKSGALNDLNLYIKEITGAAMTVSEAERLRKTMPDPENDGPTEFLAKMNKVYDETLLVRQRAMSALDQGLPDATSIPLSEIKAQITDGTLPQRRFDSLIDKGLSAAQAAEQIKKEFPSDLLKQAQENRRK